MSVADSSDISIRKRIKKRIVIKLTILVLLLILAGFFFSVPRIALWYINEKLPAVLGCSISLESLKVDPLNGRIAMGELRVGQPESFGESDMLRVSRAAIHIDLPDLLHRKVNLKAIAVSGANISLIRNSGGLNLDALFGDSDTSAPPASAEAPADRSADGEDRAWNIVFKHVSLENASAGYRDELIEREPFVVCLTNLDVTAENIDLFPPTKTELTGKIEVSCSIEQPGADPGTLSFSGETEPIADSIPNFEAELAVSNLDPGMFTGFISTNAGEAFPPGALHLASSLSYRDKTFEGSLALDGKDNRKLAAVDNVRLAFEDGSISVGDVYVYQPDGFGPSPMLSISRLDGALDVESLTNHPVRIEMFSMAGTTINIGRDKRGLFVFELFMNSDTNEAPEEFESATTQSNEPATPFIITELALTNLVISYNDYSVPGQPVELSIDETFLRLTNLVFTGCSTNLLGEPCTANMAATFKQPDRDPARLELSLLSRGTGKGLSTVLDVMLKNLDPSAFDRLPGADVIPMILREPLNIRGHATALSKGEYSAQFALSLASGMDLLVVDGIHYNPESSRIAIHELQVAQPPGSGARPLLSVSNLAGCLKFDTPASTVTAYGDGIDINVTRNSNSVFNFESWLPPDSRDPPAEQEEAGTSQPVNTADSAFLVQTIALTNINVSYSDSAIARKPFDISLKDSRILATNIMFGCISNRAESTRGSVTVRTQLAQVEHDAEIDLRATVSPVCGGIPEIDTGLDISGLDLSAFAPLLNRGAPAAFSEPLSISAVAHASPQSVSLSLHSSTASSNRFLVVENMSVGIETGHASISNVYVAQPRGFGETALLKIPYIKAELDIPALASNCVWIHQFKMHDVAVDLARDTNGLMSYDVFIPELAANDEPEHAEGASNTRTSSVHQSKTVRIDTIDISGCSVSYTDRTTPNEPLELSVTNITLGVTNLLFSDIEHTLAHGHGAAHAGACIVQPDRNDAVFSLAAVVDPSSPAGPSMSTALQLANLDLKAFDTVIPATTLEGIGSKPLSLLGHLSITNDHLSGSIALNTASGDKIAYVKELSADLTAGQFKAKDMHIVQPLGFEGDDMFYLKHAELDIATPLSATNKAVVLEYAGIETVRINLVKDKKGRLNREVYFPGHCGETGENPDPDKHKNSTPPPSPVKEPADEATRRTVLLSRFAMDDMEFRYTDHTFRRKPLTMGLTNISMSITNLVMFPDRSAPPVEPATVVLTTMIDQGSLPDGRAGFYARIGPIENAVPSMNSAFRIVDLELKAIDPILPPGTIQAIGGEALDVSGDIVTATNLLDARFNAQTISGHSFPLLTIGGTPEKPDINVSRILLGVATRLGGVLGNTARNITDATRDVANTAIQTTMAVGKGAFGVVKSIGQGLFSTVKGVAGGDLDQVGQGITQTTFGTAKDTFVNIYDIGDNVVKGAKSATETGSGRKHAEMWRADAPSRWEATWGTAINAVDKMPFPPERLKQKQFFDFGK